MKPASTKPVRAPRPTNIAPTGPTSGKLSLEQLRRRAAALEAAWKPRRPGAGMGNAS